MARIPFAVLLVLLLSQITCTNDASEPTAGGVGSDALALSLSDTVVLVGAGDIAVCGSSGHPATALLLDGIAGTVFTAGDNAYPDGSDANYAECYDPTWGRHKARTRPSPGNHEYYTPGAAGYFNYYGAAAGERGKGYYSYDLGAWHVIALNTSIDVTAASAQVQWLRADLAATARECVVAYFHHPRFSSGSNHGSHAFVRPLWDALYEHGADVVLSGHDHVYERFAPQKPDGTADPAYGIRQFTVGTGGAGLYGFGTPLPNSERRGLSRGVLKLTLWSGGYDWEFVPIAGQTFTDGGSASCHGVPLSTNQAPVANPGGPYAGEDVITFSSSGSSDPDNNLPLTYAWDFGDGATGTGAAPTHTYVADGVYTVTLRVTDAKGAVSAPAATAATIANVAPTVSVGPDPVVSPGQVLTLNATFSDPGANDAPWGYTIDWGDGTGDAGTRSDQSAITAAHVYDAVGDYVVRVTVTDKDGGVGADELIARVSNTRVLVGAGNIARCNRTNDEATAALLDGIEGTVFTAGNGVYARKHVRPNYSRCYHPSWGRHLARTRPATGSLDTWSPGSAAYYNYYGAAAGERGKGYYSYDLGDWHVIVLNSTISMAVGSAQEQWLRADLAASPKQCTVAVWGRPRFSSVAGVDSRSRPAWNALYAAGADIVVNAHHGVYERFAPQRPDGTADAVAGIREFIVGTGGISLDRFGTVRPNSEVRNSATYGVLKLTLSAGSYEWEFVPIAGRTFTDSGSGSCH